MLALRLLAGIWHFLCQGLHTGHSKHRQGKHQRQQPAVWFPCPPAGAPAPPRSRSLADLAYGRKKGGWDPGQLASSAPSPPLQLRAANPAGVRWHAPSLLHLVCPSLEAESHPGRQEKAPGEELEKAKIRVQDHSQGCGARKDSDADSGPGPAALRSLWMAGGQGRIQAGPGGRAAALQK